MRARLVWAALVITLTVPIIAAAFSPLLAWRGPVYIAASFAGILAMVLLCLQPLLMGRYLPGVSPLHSRRLHGFVGAALVIAVVVHVAGLWITSPPDVIDVLLFRAPAPFSDWGAIAMWAVFISAFLAVSRRRLRLKPRTWRIVHTVLAAAIVVGTIVHAVLIEGTMEPLSKAMLCVFITAATLKLFVDLRVWCLR